MSRELLVVWVHRNRRPEWDEPVGAYLDRIRRMQPIRDLPVRVRTAGDDPRRQQLEEEAVRKALPERCWKVLLDERGKSYRSEEFSQRLTRRIDDWPHPVAFLIGSDLGWSSSARREADETLSFGPMTLRHELARLVLYEQLYRALCISAGIKYHRPPL